VVGRAAYDDAGLLDRRLVSLRHHFRDGLDRSRGNDRDDLRHGLRRRDHDQVCNAQAAVVDGTRGGHHHDVAGAEASLVRRIHRAWADAADAADAEASLVHGVTTLGWHHHLLKPRRHLPHGCRHPPRPICLALRADHSGGSASRFDRQQRRGGGVSGRGGATCRGLLALKVATVLLERDQREGFSLADSADFCSAHFKGYERRPYVCSRKGKELSPHFVENLTGLEDSLAEVCCFL
jgi:hypothetical protein